jgi:hypothetical protein
VLGLESQSEPVSAMGSQSVLGWERVLAVALEWGSAFRLESVSQLA